MTLVVRLLAAVMLCLGAADRATAEVAIIGLDGAEESNVRAYLELSSEPCDAPEWKIRRLYGQSEAEIRAALEVYGYYSVTVQRALELSEDCWEARFDIAPGTPVTLRSVTVEVQGPGQDDPRLQALLKKNPLQVGATLDHARYEGFKKSIAEMAARRGYFDGRYATSQIFITQDLLNTDITLVYVTGERYRFGTVVIEQDVVEQALVERYVEFRPGTPYDADQISRLYEALLISGYFSSLDIRSLPQPGDEPTVEVTIRGTKSRAQTFTSGIGYGTDTGPKLSGKYNNRRRNISGHQSGISASVSPVVSEVGMNYRLPMARPRAEWLNFDTGYKYEDTDTSRSKQAQFGIKLLQLRFINWLETTSFDVSYEDYKVADTEGTSFLLVPGVAWSRTSSSGLSRPMRGYRVNAQFSGTAEEVGSTVSFFQTNLFGKTVIPLWPTARLLARVDSGYTATSKFVDLPASRRFFAGGDFSVRGYDYKSLGPKDDDGNVIGGKHLLTTSLEFDQRFAAKWSVATFVDAGNAFDDLKNMDLKFGVGAGIRWYSPLGPIRFDIAVPLEDNAPDSYRIHISLGPDL